MITTYVLARNEAANIAKCCAPFARRGTPVVVLDSGSTDATAAIASAIEGVAVKAFAYTTHADAYNKIAGDWTAPEDWALVLDADMEVTDALWQELSEAVELQFDVISAPITMYVEGRPLRFGSLCPPKAILYRGGRRPMVAHGHGERLADGLRLHQVRNDLGHNDLKDYRDFLQSQVRYANNMFTRSAVGRSPVIDRVRMALPIMPVVAFLYTYILKGGFLSGRAGLMYACDRAIAEFIFSRQAQARRAAAHGNPS